MESENMSRELLDRIERPADLRHLAVDRLPTLCAEMRQMLISSVADSGGHLSAGLGTVELTVALHYVFDTPQDLLVWDVGHQCYPHKMLTGRREQLGSIRKREGLSGFLRRDESIYDVFGAGHSSTSISAALGLAIGQSKLASELAAHPAKVVAILGDGALTAGLAYEALHHAGGLGADLLVIVNDNGMSISENVGAMADYLQRLQLPVAPTASAPQEGFFAALGFAYTGPVDGHDVAALVDTLRDLRARKGPKILHVKTRKGAGYAPAEAEPIKYHGVTPFDREHGIVANKSAAPTYTQVFGDWLCEMAEQDPALVVVTPAMREGSGLVRFAERYPDRYYDVGIAEQHAVTFAAGLAAAGLKPVVAIYSTFLQRAYDQLIHDVCLQQLPVIFAIDRAGLVGPDGATHNGSFDLAFLRCIPQLTVMTPGDAEQLRVMLRTGLESKGPCAIRYPRAAAAHFFPAPRLVDQTSASATLPAAAPIGRGERVRSGSGIALLAFGTLVQEAYQLGDIIDATVADMRFVKPLDTELIAELAASHDLLVTLEEGSVAGGAGSAVGEWLRLQQIETPLLHLGLPDRYDEHGTREECLRHAGLDVPGIFDAIARFCAELSAPVQTATKGSGTKKVARKNPGLDRNVMFNGVTRSLSRQKLR